MPRLQRRWRIISKCYFQGLQLTVQ